MIPRSVDLPIQQTLYELVLDMHGRRYRLAVENTVLPQLPLLVAHSSSAPSQYLTHADRVWHFWRCIQVILARLSPWRWSI